MAEDPDAGLGLVKALGLDPSRHDRDLLWSLIRRLEADLDGDLVRDLTLDPAVDPVLE